MAEFLPPLPTDFEPTRATLHNYARAVGVIPAVHAVAHPKWWHVSLRVVPRGLVTENMSLPGGGLASILMDLHTSEIVVQSSDGSDRRVSMTAGLSGTEMGDRLIAMAGELGLEGTYDRSKFESDNPRTYDPAVADGYFRVAANVSHLFNHHLQSLPGEVSRVQLWPHNFDLACEWFGTRVETYEEEGEVTEHPSQLNLGFYPAGRAYFYSNPFPFESEKLLGGDLPHGAEWHTGDWNGSILYYDRLAGDPDAADKLLQYARAVFDIASPTLLG